MTSFDSLPSIGKSVSWAVLGNIGNAVSQFVIVLLLARMGSPEIIGQYGLGLALATPVFLLTSLGLRNTLVIDQSSRFEFIEYATLRVISALTALMILVVLVELIGYDRDTVVIILLIGLVRAVEGLGDIVFGSFQKMERMDLVGKSLSMKATLGTAAFIVTYLLSESLALALVAISLTSFIRLFAYDLRHLRRCTEESLSSLRMSQVLVRMIHLSMHGHLRLSRLALISLPVGLSSALISFNLNVPRFALEWSSGASVLGIFTVLAYPIAVGGVVINSVSQALLPRLSRLSAEPPLDQFSTVIRKLLAIGAAVAMLTVAIAVIVGREILALFFGPTYAGYFGAFLVLVFGVGIDFPNWFLNSALMALQRTRLLLGIQMLTFCGTVLASVVFIPMYGLYGAAWVVSGAVAAQALCKFVLVELVLRRSRLVVSHHVRHMDS